MNPKNWIRRNCVFAASEKPSVDLNHTERAIFGFLADVAEYVGAKSGATPTLRVAGGWVRDKLMGQESDDIDVAIEGMTGAEFEEQVKQYAAEYEARTGTPHPALGKSYTVKANPERSKHLETVAIEIMGQKVDFVNLRSETYGDSRVPTMEMGTPEEDASRRDLTINSLFYNINTGEVEDHTGMGMEDLEDMVLRTPTDPKRTFLDDPLRMLRVLRFYSRYPDAEIAPETVEAMGDPQVQEAYRDKVAPERAGPELQKLLKGAKPAAALRAMFDTGLDEAVFNVPETEGLLDVRMDQRNKHHAHNLLEHTLLVVENMNELAKQEGLDDDTRMKMNMAALFHDYGKAHPEIGQPKEADPAQYSYIRHEDKSAEIADSVLRTIGIGRQDRDFVNKVISLHMKPHQAQWSKRSIGKFLRDAEIEGQDVGDMWKYIWLHGIADEMSKGVGDYAPDVAKKREHMQSFQDYIDTPPPAKPLLDGRAIMSMFPSLRPESGYIGEVKNRLLAEQDAGNISTVEQAQSFVESLRPEIETQFT